jgi:hypothetical protein
MTTILNDSLLHDSLYEIIYELVDIDTDFSFRSDTKALYNAITQDIQFNLVNSCMDYFFI